MRANRNLLRSGAILGVLSVCLLPGCSKPAEETAAPATPPGTTTGPTSSAMPPEAQARMQQTQDAMKARAEAQGQATMQNRQGK